MQYNFNIDSFISNYVTRRKESLLLPDFEK